MATSSSRGPVELPVASFGAWLTGLAATVDRLDQRQRQGADRSAAQVAHLTDDLRDLRANTAAVQQHTQQQISELREEQAALRVEMDERLRLAHAAAVHGEKGAASAQAAVTALGGRLARATERLGALDEEARASREACETRSAELSVQVRQVNEGAGEGVEACAEQVRHLGARVDQVRREVGELQHSHGEGVRQLNANMERWNQVISELSQELHKFQKQTNANLTRLQGELWARAPVTGGGAVFPSRFTAVSAAPAATGAPTVRSPVKTGVFQPPQTG